MCVKEKENEETGLHVNVIKGTDSGLESVECTPNRNHSLHFTPVNNHSQTKKDTGCYGDAGNVRSSTTFSSSLGVIAMSPS
jgi:hypothetical protein